MSVTIPDKLLSELILRFPFNPEDYSNIDQQYRIFFALQRVLWFCIDHCESVPNLTVPNLTDKQLLPFSIEFCKRHKLLSKTFTAQHLTQLFHDFRRAQDTIPTCGCILINQSFDALLMEGTSRNVWKFPKGKLEDNETEMQCALRETLEETGINATAYMPHNPSIYHCGDRLTLFVVPGVSDTLPLKPQELGEVEMLEWVPIEFLRIDFHAVTHRDCWPALQFTISLPLP